MLIEERARYALKTEEWQESDFVDRKKVLSKRNSSFRFDRRVDWNAFRSERTVHVNGWSAKKQRESKENGPVRRRRQRGKKSPAL
ncbi:hypothetical protein NECAME_10809 [Necator americanus]|uniref:Uncharacterized protein n=1 Tax=Necator americanus TaxID=51031 RepID=W2T848_NECAM|nr:hypothetical protein NECAME_10809 [Necator americanus]ETN77769.1 hypothetical protein NECAME_10809 [Necator americanus]